MNPLNVMKVIAGSWRAIGFAGRYAVLALSLAGGHLIARQDPDASAQTNGAAAAQVLSQLNDLMRGDDATQSEDVAPPNDVTLTNDLSESNSLTSSGDSTNRVNRFDSSNRDQTDDRKSRGRRSRSRSNQRGGSGSANDYGGDRTQDNTLGGTNNGPASLDYAAFKIIVDRNTARRLLYRPFMRNRYTVQIDSMSPALGGAGTRVTLHGSGFAAVTAVSMDAPPAATAVPRPIV